MRYVSDVDNTHVRYTSVEVVAVTDVNLKKDSLNLNFENPYDIRYSKETLE